MPRLMWIVARSFHGDNAGILLDDGQTIPLLRAILIAWAIQGVIFGAIVSSLASKKRRNPIRYFWIGFFFGLIGLLYAVGVPAITAEQYQEQMAKRQAEREAWKGEIKFSRIVVVVCIVAFVALFMIAGAFR